VKRIAFLLAGLAALPVHAGADDLYKRNNWSAMSADRRASNVGDLLTVVVYENSESSNTTRSDSRRSTQLGGTVAGGTLNESGNLQIGGGYTGGGGVTRSDKLIAQITVRIREVLPNGDMLVSGQQTMKINGENTLIGIEGRIRADDIASDNRILSSRIGDARIIYDGKGFVARSAKPGLVARVFRFLGLG